MEEFASMCGKTPVETKGELVQVGLQVGRFDGALMSAHQPSLQKRYNEMNMIEFLSSNLASGRDDMGVMIEPGGTEATVRRKTVGNDGRSRLNVITHKGLNAVGISRRHTLESNPSKFGGISFDSDKNQRFPRCTAPPCAFFVPANVRFIHFNASTKTLTATPDHDTPQFLQPSPGRLVAAKAIGVAQIPRTQAGLLRHHQPHDVKPEKQRFARPFKDRPHSNRGLMLTRTALQQSTLRAPDLLTAAAGTRKPVGPPDPLQVALAIRVALKPIQEFFEGLRIWIFGGRFHFADTLHMGGT